MSQLLLRNIRAKAVLFDLDGTLVDSLPQHIEAWRQACRSFNLQMHEDQIYEFEGATSEALARIFYRDKGIEDPSEAELAQLVDLKERNYAVAVLPDFMEGALELLEDLSLAEIPFAVVTGAREVHKRFETVPRFTELIKVAVTAKETPRGKPHPDPFLIGARSLSVDPAQCLVVENAPFGLKAAVSAGCHAVAVQESSPLTAELLIDAGAEHVFSTVKLLAAEIRFIP